MAERKVSEARSRNMAAIRGTNTSPEIKIRKALHAAGFRFRLHSYTLPGKPDIVLPRYRAVIFVHGCFWHYHGCKNSVWPKTRADFWREKLSGNKRRDRRNKYSLQKAGWKVFTVWECDVRAAKSLPALQKLLPSMKDLKP